MELSGGRLRKPKSSVKDFIGNFCLIQNEIHPLRQFIQKEGQGFIGALLLPYWVKQQIFAFQLIKSRE
ncbi:MAG: hypothetical protein C0410_02545 [Anaerolinea sp.]|nr:hypothetical protein [Anaerolinea sp.]